MPMPLIPLLLVPVLARLNFDVLNGLVKLLRSQRSQCRRRQCRCRRAASMRSAPLHGPALARLLVMLLVPALSACRGP